MRRVVLLAGPSGSGKTRVAVLSRLPILRLDDFYRDESPELPRHEGGYIDWDDPLTWDAEAAADALAALARSGEAVVPEYDIATSRRVGTKPVVVTGAAVIAEGVFATELLAPCRERGLDPIAVWLDRPRVVNWWHRLVRDLREHRKPVAMLLQRGAALYRDEPALRQAALAAGFRPMGQSQAILALRPLSA
jgi:uridine kinase